MRVTSNEQLEQLLASALERCTPDIWGELCASSAPAQAMEAPGRPAVKKRRYALRRALACACACLALMAGTGAFAFFHAAAVIGIDVNPSLEIRVNRFDRVLAVEARNEDARAILGDMELRYVDLDTAINALVGSMVRQGYLADDGAVLVSVTGGSSKRNIRLEQVVVRDIQSSLEEAGGSGAVYTEPPQPGKPQGTPTPQEPAPADKPAAPAAKPAAPQPPPDDHTAGPTNTSGVSEAKQRLIDRIRRGAPSLQGLDLAALSVEELIELADEYDVDLSGILQKRGDDEEDDRREGEPRHGEADDDDEEDDRGDWEEEEDDEDEDDEDDDE